MRFILEPIAPIPILALISNRKALGMLDLKLKRYISHLHLSGFIEILGLDSNEFSFMGFKFDSVLLHHTLFLLSICCHVYKSLYICSCYWGVRVPPKHLASFYGVQANLTYMDVLATR